MTAVKARDEAVAGLEAAFGTWSEVARGIWSQAAARMGSCIAEIESERRRRATRARAAETQLAALGPDDDPGPAQLALASVRASLGGAELALAGAREAEQEFRAAQRRSLASLDTEIPRARADLRRRLGHLTSYRATGGAPGSTSGVHAGGTGEGASAAAVRALGMEDVGLGSVDFSDNPITGSLGHGGASVVDYRWAVETWEGVVRAGVGRGLKRDDFAARDEARGAAPMRRTADVYDLFLGDTDRIVLSKRADGTYDVVNGRHRVEAARQLGINSLPARVVP